MLKLLREVCVVAIISLTAVGVNSCGGPSVQYEIELDEFAMANGLTQSWVDWMVEYKDHFIDAYTWARQPISAGGAHRTLSIAVRYSQPVVYDPPWSSEAEHFAAYERMLALHYPGWTFHVSDVESVHTNLTVVLGYDGTSHANLMPRDEFTASGARKLGTVYLHYETIVAHELAHLLYIWHHYDEPGDNKLHHPEEGRCIMNRTGSIFGPAERFALQLEHPDEEAAKTALKAILVRYPDH